MPALTAIALSGGIDSLVSAALLKDQGHQLIGLHFLSGFESFGQNELERPAAEPNFDTLAEQARSQLAPMVDQLDIPIHIVDLRTEFQREVVDYFTATYQAAKTPNPCLACNPSIKFGVLFEKARTWGADHMATGHYARIQQNPNGNQRLLRGIDPIKEQSYFLARLTQEQLARAILPLGELTKEQTRQIARQKGLQPVCSKESQDICFIPNGSYGDFLKKQPGFESLPGIIQDTHGQVIGRHKGLHLFTIGQRRGINCPAAEPYYVVSLDIMRNRLIVGFHKDLFFKHCQVTDINWISSEPQGPIKVMIRLRYRHTAVVAQLVPLEENTAEITFKEPQTAVTPGQGAVFYRNDEVLGGGWIQ